VPLIKQIRRGLFHEDLVRMDKIDNDVLILNVDFYACKKQKELFFSFKMI